MLVGAILPASLRLSRVTSRLPRAPLQLTRAIWRPARSGRLRPRGMERLASLHVPLGPATLRELHCTFDVAGFGQSVRSCAAPRPR